MSSFLKSHKVQREVSCVFARYFRCRKDSQQTFIRDANPDKTRTLMRLIENISYKATMVEVIERVSDLGALEREEMVLMVTMIRSDLL